MSTMSGPFVALKKTIASSPTAFFRSVTPSVGLRSMIPSFLVEFTTPAAKAQPPAP